MEKSSRKIKYRLIKGKSFYSDSEAAVREKFDESKSTVTCLNQKSQFVLNCWFLTGGYFSLTVIGAVAYFVGIGIREDVAYFRDYLNEVAKVYLLEEYSTWGTGFYVLVIGKIRNLS